MFAALQAVIAAIYLVLPAIVLGYALAPGPSRRARLKSFVLTVISAAFLSLGFCLLYALLAGGRVTIGQVLLGVYFATAMLLLVKLFDDAVRWAVRTILFIPRDKTQVEFSYAFLLRIALAALLRVAIVAAVVLPYVMTSIMTYRPRLYSDADPRTQSDLDFQRVAFASTDGLKLAGWWIPAAEARPAHETVLVCHGFASDKSKQAVLVRELAHGGFNVLAFDFRAHCESAGQLTTYGDLERRDVLGAVRWLHQNHAIESRRITGVGASLGAAALIAAAVDPSDQGRAISAVACYETYDSVTGLTRTITHDYFFPPLAWLVRNLGIRLASAQTGADLQNFDVAKMLPQLWPRPVLLIHGEKDTIVDFSHATRLYESATQPKYYLWLEKSDYDAAIKNQGAARVVVKFLQTARDEPVI